MWTCPVCGPRIRQLRADDVRHALHQWFGTGWGAKPRQDPEPDPNQFSLSIELPPRVPLAPRRLTGHGPGSVLFLTLTLPHDYGEELATVLNVVRSAFSRLVAGYAWQKDKKEFGLRHYIRAHDVTFGPNGPHPHLHILLFAERGLTEAQLHELRARLFSRWVHVVGALDRRAPTWEHGVRLEAARTAKDLAFYLAQVMGEERLARPDLELARGDLKSSRHAGHRTPWQVLSDYHEKRRPVDLKLWKQWETATRGVHSIRWSKGLRTAVGLGDDMSDEQLVMLEVGGELVYTFTPTLWGVIRVRRGILADVLEAAEQAGTLGVKRLLKSIDHEARIDAVSDWEYTSAVYASTDRQTSYGIPLAVASALDALQSEGAPACPDFRARRAGKAGAILAGGLWAPRRTDPSAVHFYGRPPGGTPGRHRPPALPA